MPPLALALAVFTAAIKLVVLQGTSIVSGAASATELLSPSSEPSSNVSTPSAPPSRRRNPCLTPFVPFRRQRAAAIGTVMVLPQHARLAFVHCELAGVSCQETRDLARRVRMIKGGETVGTGRGSGARCGD